MTGKNITLRIILNIPTVIALFIAMTATTALATSVTLRWDPNDPSPAGYRVYIRKAGQSYDYSHPHWEGSATSCTLADLENNTLYFFVVRAYAGNLESVDSEQVYHAPPTTDSDFDGMPDLWEIEFGFDYLTDDSDGDADDDEISNRDEYRAGMEPDFGGTGTPPASPVAFTPDRDAPVETTTMLAVEDYSDADGDANIATQWQVYDEQTGTCLLDVITTRSLTLAPLPELLLNGYGSYSWRTRFFDSGGLASGWSADSHFSTQAEIGDNDGNGIPDNQEVGAIRADGVQSLVSPAMFSEPTAVEISSGDTGSVIERIARLNPAEFDVYETTPLDPPSAMLAYKLALDRPGQRVSLTFHLSSAAPAGAQWVGYDEFNGWKPYADHAEISDDRQSVRIEVCDGGVGDADGIANGIILDTAGLQPAAVGGEVGNGDAQVDGEGAGNGGGAGGGGGCFLTSMHSVKKGVSHTWRLIQRRVLRLVG